MKMSQLLATLSTKLIHKEKVALATVVSASGSAPQVPGSMALFGADGLIAGTIGGGPAEYQVMLKAKEALRSRKSEILRFNLAGIPGGDSDSICGGTMSILLDAQPHLHREVWSQINKEVAEHNNGVLFSILLDGIDNIFRIRRFWIVNGVVSQLPEEFREVAAMALQGMNAQETRVPCRFLEFPYQITGTKSVWFFLQPVIPPPSLVIAGAGHVGKAVAHVGKFLGYEVTIWDDRPDFAHPSHCPDADHHFTGPFEEFTRQLSIDDHTWLVIVTRGHQFDAVVLREWIKTSPAYLGMMGSRSKVAQLRDLFLSKGWASEEEWNRVHTPIGFKIGAKTVEEIAISIAAELVQEKYKNIIGH